MASLSDIFSTAQNVVKAISNLASTYLKVQGISRSETLTATTLVSSGNGRLASVSVVSSSGSVDGMIYDSNNVSVLTRALAVIDHTPGVRVMNLPYTNGLVVAPGSGMTVVVTYSEE